MSRRWAIAGSLAALALPVIDAYRAKWDKRVRKGFGRLHAYDLLRGAAIVTAR